MSTISIPSHYSNNYVHRRYNRALQIVQHLPNHFQPSKEQKLKLYSYYKQVAHGDIDTPRPGLFDIVGRAKWDSWNNIKGMTKLEAEHRYVETLLRTVSEAFQNPACRAQAQQILQIFATMKPTDGDDDTTDDDITTTTTEDDHEDTDNINDDDLNDDDNDDDIDNDDEDSSEGSIDEEEKAYLYEIQQNAGRATPGTVFRQKKKKKRRAITPLVPPSSISSPHQRYLQHSNSSQQSLDRPITPSTYSKRSFNNNNNNNNKKLTMRNISSPLSRPLLSSTNNNNNANSTNGNNEIHIVPPRDSPYYDNDDHFDNTENPWVAVSASSTSTITAVQKKRHNDQNTPPLLLSRSLSPNTTITSTTTSLDYNNNRRQSDSRATNHSTISSVQHLPSPIMGRPNSRLKNLHSPFHGSSTASSVTATFSNTRSTLQRHQQLNSNINNQPSSSSTATTTNNNNNTSITSLSPETKRALQSLQAEVIALNDRIDDLRHELLRRDKQRHANSSSSSSKDKKDKDGDGWEESWRWVINAALKYFAVNIISASIMFLILYKRNNTVAYVIIDEFSKMWHKAKLKLKITGVVV